MLGYQNYEPDLDTYMSKAMYKIYSLTDVEKEEINLTDKLDLLFQDQILSAPLQDFQS